MKCLEGTSLIHSSCEGLTSPLFCHATCKTLKLPCPWSNIQIPSRHFNTALSCYTECLPCVHGIAVFAVFAVLTVCVLCLQEYTFGKLLISCKVSCTARLVLISFTKHGKPPVCTVTRLALCPFCQESLLNVYTQIRRCCC